MYLDVFIYIKKHPKPLRDDEYMTMCMNMSDEDELPFSEGSQDLYNAIYACQQLILDPPYNYVISYVKPYREKYSIPRSHFWWYIDEL